MLALQGKEKTIYYKGSVWCKAQAVVVPQLSTATDNSKNKSLDLVCKSMAYWLIIHDWLVLISDNMGVMDIPRSALWGSLLFSV